MPVSDTEESNEVDQAISALEFFLSKFLPAPGKNEADVFFTTDEIAKAIEQHTGVRLANSNIYNLLVKRSYAFDFIDQQFNWLFYRADVLR